LADSIEIKPADTAAEFWSLLFTFILEAQRQHRPFRLPKTHRA
jgi:hypothetical protein